MATSAPSTGFPDASNTGLPAGVTLTPSGSLVIYKAGTVISGLDISGSIIIEAPNVTVTNCKITSSGFALVQIQAGITGTVVQNCEINGTGSNNSGSTGIFGSGTFIGNNIYNVENGIAVSQGSTSTVIKDNYIHNLLASGSPHYDGIQIDGGLSNVSISHNTVINSYGQTSALMIDNYFGALSNINVSDNILAGGGYTIYDYANFNSSTVTGVSFTNNHLGMGQWGNWDIAGTTPISTGNVSDAAALVATLNTPANDAPATPVVTVALNNDTGGSATDKITADATLKGHADAGAIVTFLSGTTKVGSTTADASGNWTFKPVLADGSYTITASETNSAGNVGTANITFKLDTKPYVLTMALVSDNGVSSTDSITSNDALWGHANWYTPVTISENGKVITTVTADANGIWSYNPTLSDGAHTLVATEYDVAGNASTAKLSFTLDTTTATAAVQTMATAAPTAPFVSGALKHDTGISAADNYTSDATLTGNTVAGAVVTFSEGTTKLGSTTADANGAWTYKPTLADGAHTIVASESNQAVVVATASIGFTLDTNAPTVSEMLKYDTGASATDNVTTNPTLTGWTQPGASVKLTENGATLGVAAANSNGAWAYTPSSMAAGVQTILSAATDQAGNVASSTLTFTLSQPFAA